MRTDANSETVTN